MPVGTIYEDSFSEVIFIPQNSFSGVKMTESENDFWGMKSFSYPRKCHFLGYENTPENDWGIFMTGYFHVETMDD